MADAPTPFPGTPTRVPAAETPPASSLTKLAVAVVVVAALYVGREILVPITLAVLLSFVLAPVADFLRRWHLGRLPSVLISVVLALGIILALAGLIGTQVAQLAGDIPRYQTTIQVKVNDVQNLTLGRLSAVVNRLGHEFERPAPNANAPAPATSQAAPAGQTEAQKPIPVEVHQPAPTPFELARRFVAPILSPIETTGIIFVVAIFILMQKEDLRDRLIRLFGSTDLHRTTVALNDAAHRLSRYFLTQLAINTTFGVIIGTGLFLIGVPSPLLWGVIAALMRFIPYVGAFLAALGPVALAAAIDPGWTDVLWTAGLFIVVEPIMGQVVEPLLYGHSTGLSPISVVVAAIFWGWLWGPIGLILSMPLTLCCVVLGRHVEHLEFFDVLLGDRPALTPVENFYQRLLAGDADEVQDHADLLLKERSLSSYYDEVALKGLQLAAADAARGVLGHAQLERIKNEVAELVAGFDDYDDKDPAPTETKEEKNQKSVAGPGTMPRRAEQNLPKEPAPSETLPPPETLAPEWRSANPVLCVAGRGPLDEAASMLLAQLLNKHGIKARVVPYGAVSRSAIAGLDAEGTAMVCISYLDLSGRPSHLRHMIRRLRQRLPHARILVGLWPTGEAALTDAATQQFLGADDYVASLREAVNACLRAARDSSGAQAASPSATPPHNLEKVVA